MSQQNDELPNVVRVYIDFLEQHPEHATTLIRIGNDVRAKMQEMGLPRDHGNLFGSPESARTHALNAVMVIDQNHGTDVLHRFQVLTGLKSIDDPAVPEQDSPQYKLPSPGALKGREKTDFFNAKARAIVAGAGMRGHGFDQTAMTELRQYVATNHLQRYSEVLTAATAHALRDPEFVAEQTAEVSALLKTVKPVPTADVDMDKLVAATALQTMMQLSARNISKQLDETFATHRSAWSLAVTSLAAVATPLPRTPNSPA